MGYRPWHVLVALDIKCPVRNNNKIVRGGGEGELALDWYTLQTESAFAEVLLAPCNDEVVCDLWGRTGSFRLSSYYHRPSDNNLAVL
jgi:hypothetical protein